MTWSVLWWRAERAVCGWFWACWRWVWHVPPERAPRLMSDRRWRLTYYQSDVTNRWIVHVFRGPCWVASGTAATLWLAYRLARLDARRARKRLRQQWSETS